MAFLIKRFKVENAKNIIRLVDSKKNNDRDIGIVVENTAILSGLIHTVLVICTSYLRTILPCQNTSN